MVDQENSYEGWPMKKMKKTLKVAAILGFALAASAVVAGEVELLKTPKDKVNYGIGVSTIRNFKQYGTGNDIDLDMVIKGMKDEFSGNALLLSEKELREVLTAVQTEIMQKKRTARALATMQSASTRTTTGQPNNQAK